MGSLTLKVIRDLVILDCGIQANPQFPPVRVNKEINLAQYYVQMQLNGLGMKHWEKVGNGNVLMGSFAGTPCRLITVSSDLPDMLEMPGAIKYITTTGVGGVNGIGFEVDDRQFLKQMLNTYSAPSLTEPIFCRVGGQIFAAPNTISTIQFTYYKRVAPLTTDASLSEIPDEYEDFILARAEFQIKNKMGLIKDAVLESKAIDNAIAEAYNKYLGAIEQAHQKDSVRPKAE